MISILFDNQLDYGLRILLFLSVVLALVFAFALHEFAHAYVALLNGDRTAKLNGRVSLNPIRHLDPIGSFMILLVGFGYAKPVPVNPNNFKHKKRGMFFVSVAGITVNLILSFLFVGVWILLLKYTGLNLNSTSGLQYFANNFFDYFVTINLSLLFFNMLPIFPLDGFNMLSSFLSPRNRGLKFLQSYGAYILMFLIGLSLVVDYVDLNTVWWRRLDVLGEYIRFCSTKLGTAIIQLWSKIFGF